MFRFNNDVLDFQVEKVLSIVMIINYFFVKTSIFIAVYFVSRASLVFEHLKYQFVLGKHKENNSQRSQQQQTRSNKLGQ